MSGNNVDARAFFRQYAAEIAEAFREQEEAPRQASLEESVPDLYRSLCFDEPMIESEAASFSIVVSGLSRQLLSSSSPYALSDRLVNGILYLSKRKDASDTKSNTAPTQESIAMAKLAFCVLVQLPLQICQNFGNFSAVKKYLGSYKGSLASAKDKNSAVNADDNTINDSAIEQRVNKITEAINGTRNMTVDDAQDDSALNEVWAAESDPSDYDYCEGVPDHPPHSGFQFQEEDWLDPPRLSKPDPALSKDQVRLAVGSLLNQANYNVLEPIFALSKKEVEKYTSELSQLILILLQPQNPLGNGDANMDLPLQDAILSPLWILRDAAIHCVSTQQRQSFSSSYLEVLQTLLAVDQAHLQDLGRAMSNKNVELCTASIVGLSAMSSWCGMSEISIPSTITSVLDAMNDISYVVERASEKYKSSLLHSLIPIMELLSGITFDQAQNAGISNSSAQTLMSSGFLRQLLVLGLEEGIENAHRFHHALWGLSVSHPKIVGKYVARYPGTPQLVRGYTVAAESSSQDCVSSILWNGFGWVHSEGAGQTQAPRVVWKTSSAKQTGAAPPLSRDECTEVCQKSWTRLCQIVESSMTGSSKEPEKALEALHDWERFLSFMTVASMASTFVELLDSSHLQKIVKALSVISQQHVQEEEKAEAAIDGGTDGTVDDPDGKLKSPKSNHQMIIPRARKLIKQYTLIFQGNIAGSSKTD
jgi:hypothetical protein